MPRVNIEFNGRQVAIPRSDLEWFINVKGAKEIITEDQRLEIENKSKAEIEKLKNRTK